jgi:hypothetical protein
LRCTAAAARPTRSPPNREARDALVEQVGIEPGPELRRLQEAILAQDAALEAPATVAEWARADAARRLDAAVGRVASERAELRAAEDEVAGGVEELQAARTAGARIVPARSRVSRRSTATTRGCSSGASGSSPRWSPGWPALR